MNPEAWLMKHNIDEAMRIFVDRQKNMGDHTFLHGLANNGFALVQVSLDVHGNIYMEAAEEVVKNEYNRGYANGRKGIRKLRKELGDAEKRIEEKEAALARTREIIKDLKKKIENKEEVKL